jgi:hypothetical protein
MNIYDIATKGDLIGLEKRLDERFASKDDLANLEKRLEERFASKTDLTELEKRLEERFASKTDLTELEKRLRQANRDDLTELEERLDTKIDTKTEQMARRVVDEITEVIGDLMEHADARFRRLEKATGQPQGWQQPFKRRLKPADS